MFDPAFTQVEIVQPYIARDNEAIQKRGRRNIVDFLESRERSLPFLNDDRVIMVCSPGRSGSTLLFDALKPSVRSSTLLKSHLLPPPSSFKGKILFIFSNPDRAAESIVHIIDNTTVFGTLHFKHVETADHHWLNRIGDVHHQTEDDNLLSYDGLGCYDHLDAWLHSKVLPCSAGEAQILAIKYEELWGMENEIKEFLGLQWFELPPKKERGYDSKELSAKESLFRQRYNLGTTDEPRYAAYDAARSLWEQAPAFQYLKISTSQ